MKNRDRQVAVLVASGLTGAEVAAKMALAPRTIDGIKADPEVRALIDRLEQDGITPRQKLEALMCSANDQVALKAAESLARLGVESMPSGGTAIIHIVNCPRCGATEVSDGPPNDEAAP